MSRFSLLVFILFAPCWLYGRQSGSLTRLKGTITDSKTGEPLVGVSVQIKALTETAAFGAVSGLDGSFLVKDIPTGTYQIQTTYISYEPFGQEIRIDGEQNLKIALKEVSQMLNEVVISESNRVEEEGGARVFEQKADQLTNVVSARAIQISPDLTVANVVQRISGISIERNSNGDGQYAIVRGMDKRYNYTLVNGIKIPSPDNKYRYVPLDIFPSDLLQRLEVYKSLTPSMEGDAVGGVINMVMKDAPDEFMFNANLALGVNQLFLNRSFVSFDKSAIQTKSPYERNSAGYNANTSDFSSGLIDYQSRRPSNVLGGFALGNRFLGSKLGVILAFSAQNTFRGSRSVFFEPENVDTMTVPVLTKMRERFYSEQQERYGLHNKMDYQFNSRHKISFYNAYMWFSNTQVRETKTLELSFGYQPEQGNANLEYQWRSRRTIQQILTSTLQGEHSFGKLKAQWSAVYAFAKNEQPENTNISIFGDRRNFVDRLTTAKNMSRRWEHNNDNDLTFYANLTYRENLGAGQLEIMSGGMYRDKTRTNFYNNYTFNSLNPKDTFGIHFTDFTQIGWSIFNPRGSVATALAYDATEKISAGYAQFKYTLDKLQIISGLRIENTDQGYKMRFPIGEDRPTGNQNYTDLLPSLHLKYSRTSKQNLRASYFKSINRPGFFEIVPYRIVNEDFQERGNPDLKRAIAQNFDVRYELFPKAGEQVMVGLFYKTIKDPIEFTLQRDKTRGQDVFEGPGNFGTVTNYGLEFDFMKFFSWFGIKVNYTYTISQITTPKSKRIRNENGDLQTISVQQTRPLYGQSDHIANLILIVKSVKHGFDAQLTTNYTGKRIVTVSQFVDSDLWQQSFIQTDFSLEKTFKKKYTVFAKANNLLDTPLRVYIKGTNSMNGDVPNQNFGSNTLVRTDYYGQSYLIGFRFKLN
jgi:hypothetical protein